VIQIKHASCHFRHASGSILTALNDVDTTIADGEFVCLLGQSGHGKSTLLRSLAGLNRLSSGSIAVDGQEVVQPGGSRAMVFQDDTVFPWMRVQENVEFGMKCQGLGSSERRQAAETWLSAVGLVGSARSWPKELSGGMRKRVAIASVFATGAPILLMDEPFGALDYVTRTHLQDLLIDMWKTTRRTIVFVTHDIEEALVLANRLIILKHGEIRDDIQLTLPRPRDEVVRASTEAVSVTRTILQHLGLKSASDPRRPQ
jgi:NitT/TauT family transport system ATP-binding protein